MSKNVLVHLTSSMHGVLGPDQHRKVSHVEFDQDFITVIYLDGDTEITYPTFNVLKVETYEGEE